MSGISIVLTYYKGEKFIENCINSLTSSYQASSKLLAYEIVVVIDSMEDADRIESLLSTKYKNDHIIIIKNEKNIGVAESRNKGLKAIKNNFYTIIDQDDYVEKEYFSVLEKELDVNVPVHFINGVISYVNENIKVPIYTFEPKFKFKSLILLDTFIYTPGLLIFNTAFVPSNGLFVDTSPDHKGCDDWAAYLNLILSSTQEIRYKFINRSLFVYVLHDTNYSNDKEEMIRSSMAVLKYLRKHKNLDARRAKLVEKAQSMQDFYISRDVKLASKASLLFNYPSQFLYKYFFSLFTSDNMNKIILKLRYRMKK